jgi:hypothetical protein
MEQLKTALAALKKHHFWALCGAVILIAPAGWWMATGSVVEKFDERTSKLDSSFNQMRKIGQTSNHPNDEVIEAIKEETEDLKADVFKAWQHLHTQQKKKNPLPDVLGDRFITAFNNLGPKDELGSTYLDNYMNFIRDHLPGLLEKYDIRRPAPAGQETADVDREESRPTRERGFGTSFGASSARDGRQPKPAAKTAPAEKMIGVVDWDPNDREDFEKRFDWERRPTTQQVQLAQEDSANYSTGTTGPGRPVGVRGPAESH